MFDFILLMAGSGTRTSLKFNKVNYKINNKELYKYSLEKVLSMKECHNVILVVREEDLNDYKPLENDRIKITIGGQERYNSVYNGALVASTDIILIHDAARCNIQIEEIQKVYEEAKTNDAVSLCIKAKDCIKELDGNKLTTLDRNKLYQMQTPQAVNRKLLIEGINKNPNIPYLDDVQVLEYNYGINAKLVLGRNDNIKVTTDEDISYMEYLLNNKTLKIGHSKDTHRLVEGRRLVLGGVTIPFYLGLAGHSDADVVYHAVVEAIIGALGMGDIGTLFPDTDMKYKDIDSSYFMKEIYDIMNKQGYKINNIDVIIYIEKPMLKEYKPLMRKNIASLLHTDELNVNVKATRGEGIGYIGNMEGISAEAVCTIVSK